MKLDTGTFKCSINGVDLGIAYDLQILFPADRVREEGGYIGLGKPSIGTITMKLKIKNIRKLRKQVVRSYTENYVQDVGLSYTNVEIHNSMGWRRLIPYRWCSNLSKAKAVLKLETNKNATNN